MAISTSEWSASPKLYPTGKSRVPTVRSELVRVDSAKLEGCENKGDGILARHGQCELSLGFF
jgi:hypothetical protein